MQEKQDNGVPVRGNAAAMHTPPTNGIAPNDPVAEQQHIATLEAIQRRVLWLAVNMVHHANNVRPNHDGTKIGGHQASSASMVTLMTALYFHALSAGDRVAVKPHASPVFHAIQYLLGNLPRAYLTELRAFGGLQSYPSRTKDPDPIDFSTGSVGLGAVAPAFAALTHRYASAHFGTVTSRRFVALLGDAELDEGSVWEAVLDHALDGLDNLLWIIDLNRQSLDRVVPGIRGANLKSFFGSAGWQVLEVKYGRQLQALFDKPDGDLLRQRIDEMSNEEYQALIRLPGDLLRPRLIAPTGHESPPLAALLAEVPDEALPGVLANLGGHDMGALLAALEQANTDGRPTVLFAYTIKGWGLPIAGHPLNHSMLLNTEQWEALRQSLGIVPGDEWAAFAPNTPEAELCAEAARRLHADEPAPVVLPQTAVPHMLDLPTSGPTSTQDAFGRALVRLADVPDLRDRIVTTSPDVSISTNLAGWINKNGVFTPADEPDYETEAYRLLKWKRGPTGRHIELGISEMNLFMLLGMLGLSAELCGQQIIPIGTVYDPFVCRGLDALIYALYSGSKCIVVGTPSGITLAPEGGAHQSTVTPSLGIELPNLDAYEPCFAQEVEWILLESLRQCCDREHGRSTYLRLSTRAMEQDALTAASKRLGGETLHQQVLAGGYRLLEGSEAAGNGAPVVQLAVCGTLVPEALAAAQFLQREGVAANVLNLTSPRRLYERWQASRRQLMRGEVASDAIGWLIPPQERRAPIVTIHDAATHALAWLGGVYGAPVTALGVDSFGQSGARADLYRAFGVDTDSIVVAAFEALDAAEAH